MGYAGAICFRKAANEIEYLLINTTARRKLFPKGRISKEPSQAAVKYARDEGGARGRIIEHVSKVIKYYKEENSEIQSLQIFLLEVTDTFQPRQRLAQGQMHVERAPKWYLFEDALGQITSKRDYRTSYEIADAMEWAKKQIERYFRRA